MHFKVLYCKNKENVNLRQQSIATVTLSGDTERPPSLLRWTVPKKHTETARCRESGLKTTCELLQPVTLFFPTSKTAPLREAKTAPRGPAEGPSSCPRHFLPSLCTVPIPAPSGAGHEAPRGQQCPVCRMCRGRCPTHAVAPPAAQP